MSNPLDSNPAWLSPYPVLPLRPRPRSNTQRWPGLRKWAANIIAAGGNVQTVQLSYTETADLTQGLSSGAWTDIIANQNFTVANAGSVLWFALGGFATGGNVGSELASRLLIDSAGTPLPLPMGGCYADYKGSIFAGATPHPVTGLAAGVHTLKPQAWCFTGGASLQLRAASYPDVEHMLITVLEVAPPA